MALPRTAEHDNETSRHEPGEALVVADTRIRTVSVIDADAVLGDLSKKLSGLGYHVVDGRFAEPPEDCVAVIMNIAMDPDLVLTRSLAQKHRIVLIAENRDFDFRLQAARAGVEAVLWSPLDLVDLGAWLADFDDAEKEAYTILIVDDDELAAETYALTLEAAGMHVHVVTDATLATEAVGQVMPDLVLMDLQMPGASGLEIARVIRQSRQHLSLPIVFLSAERDPERQHMARKVGGDDFIVKPVNLENLAGLVGIRAERAQALRQVMERDSLTGLLNHARFKDRLAAEFERSRRTQSPLAVCLLDLDHFKRVNDTYGHQAGDRVLQTLAHSLAGALRRTDVVARYGGEEFAILLLDTPVEDAFRVMEKIRTGFGNIVFDSESGPYSVTLSVGICNDLDAVSTESMVRRADEALYAAKRNGRNQVKVADRE
ncbi:GGDEF domain-containing protein [Mariluticola halotolerans]|uniref:GGDEF domain-containing protein n=1 Tax=Mariluticola halotolerans TaxID=2909283 RepID=UPI0026E44B33|nr:diguanylate cyclase [Mariluticola halotolerans]UJQ93994.1 diguanylate cyclase [Mariluticola halotolerans]